LKISLAFKAALQYRNITIQVAAMDVTKASMLINGIIFHGSYMLYQDPVAHNLNVFAIDITAN